MKGRTGDEREMWEEGGRVVLGVGEEIRRFKVVE